MALRSRTYKKISGKAAVPTFETSTELSIARQQPAYAKPNLNPKTAIFGSPRPNTPEVYPGE